MSDWQIVTGVNELPMKTVWESLPWIVRVKFYLESIGYLIGATCLVAFILVVLYGVITGEIKQWIKS